MMMNLVQWHGDDDDDELMMELCGGDGDGT